MKPLKKQASGELGRFIAGIPWGEETQPQRTRIVFEGKREVDAHMQIDRIGKVRKEAETELTKVLSKADVKQLLDGEKQLFQWLGEDKTNPVRFAFDPLGSLAAAGIKLSDAAASAIAAHRAAQKRTQGGDGLNDLASLRVSVAGSEAKYGK